MRLPRQSLPSRARMKSSVCILVPQDVLVALSLDFRDNGTASEVEQAVTRIERRIKAAHPEVRRVFIEAQDRDAHSRSQPPVEAEALTNSLSGADDDDNAAV